MKDDLVKLAELVRVELRSASVEVLPAHEFVWIVRGPEKVAIAEARELIDETSVGQTLLSSLYDGSAMLILIGEVETEPYRELTERGVFEVHPSPPDPFRLANAVRNALDTQRLRVKMARAAQQVRRNRYELREFTETARIISSERSVEALLETILERCREITSADAGTIYTLERAGEEGEFRLRFRLAQNDSVHIDSQEFVVPVSRTSMAGAAVLDREVINIEDAQHMPPELPFQHNVSFDERTGYRTRSILSAPMISQTGEVIGVVQLINRKRTPQALLLGQEDFDELVIPFDARCIELVSIWTAHAAVSLKNAQLYEENALMLDGFVKASVHAIEQRDPPTSGHSERVASLTLELARVVETMGEGKFAEVSFTDEEMLELRYAGLLHDFGKIGVPEAVLTKQKKLAERVLEVIEQRFEAARLSIGLRQCSDGDEEAEVDRLDRAWKFILRANEPAVLDAGEVEELEQLGAMRYVDSRGVGHPLLTEHELSCLSIRRGSLTKEEFDQIRSHAGKTDEFLSRIPWGRGFEVLPLIASSHHERLDGTGYPQGLEDKNIPLKAKMMAVADVFDALTAADRPYKKAVPLERALKILDLEAASTHLDPELVRLFKDHRVYECLEAGGEESS